MSRGTYMPPARRGVPGTTHCGSWRKNPAGGHSRVVCDKAPGHNGWHMSDDYKWTDTSQAQPRGRQHG
ncbi:MAG TPA: hypothetical protein VEO01_15590 [Pseudonocardiaceae bacterium]|nr:hypothetical protein [Pseudonocardiaceae bacterium]